MCWVPAIGSLRSFGWCWLDTAVLLSLAPWPAPRLLPFLSFLTPPTTLQTGCCSSSCFVGGWLGGLSGASKALKARIRFSRLLRRPSDPRTATVMASKRGGRTLMLDIIPRGGTGRWYQSLSEVASRCGRRPAC